MDARRKTALVTGASSGLGVEFARLLAAQDVDLVLTARRQDRLTALAGELSSRHGVAVQTLTADLAAPAGAQELLDAVERLSLPIDILVNNAGFGLYGNFLDQSPAEIDALIQVNLSAATRLTRHFAARMKDRGGGSILLVSSYAGLQPIPRYAVYSAAKAYLVALAQALRHELRRDRVAVSVLCPGFMHTEFHDVAAHRRTRAMRWLSIAPRHTAARGLAGLERRRLLITPGVCYQINNVLLRLMPRTAASALSAAVVRSNRHGTSL